MTKETKPKDNVVDAPPAAQPGTAIVSWKDKMALVTAQAGASEAPKGGFLSFKGGNMSYNEEPIPGNKMDVIVVDFLLENAMFRDKYNPNRPASPMCYAFGREEADMKPHEEAEEPQNPQCEDCPNNEWASDPEGGRGKACKNSRRIAVLPADILLKGSEAIRKASVVMCKLPVTSIKLFSAYINQCVKVLEKPPFAVVVELSTTPHPANLFSVNWKIKDVIASDELLEALYNKRVSIEKLMLQPYPKFEDEPAPAPRGGKAKY